MVPVTSTSTHFVTENVSESENNKEYRVETENPLFRYTRETGYAIVGYNTKILNNIYDPKECAEKCNISNEFVCKSFEHEISKRVCKLSDKNRYDVINQNKYINVGHNTFIDYYEKQSLV